MTNPSNFVAEAKATRPVEFWWPTPSPDDVAITYSKRGVREPSDLGERQALYVPAVGFLERNGQRIGSLDTWARKCVEEAARKHLVRRAERAVLLLASGDGYDALRLILGKDMVVGHHVYDLPRRVRLLEAAAEYW